MVTEELVEKIILLTEQKLNAWKCHNGYAPVEASNKLDNVMFDWIISLTASLRMWVKKGLFMTDGELILACANLGSLVESMMKLVLSVHILDYYRDPLKNDKGKVVQPEKIKFKNLKTFCFDKVWPETETNHYGVSYKAMKEWVGEVEEKRNAIHAFNKKELGSASDFINDIGIYWEFVNLVFDTLPADPYYE